MRKRTYTPEGLARIRAAAIRRWPPLAERFWAKVRKTEECWVWTAYRMRTGYGRFGVGPKSELAHVVSLRLAGVEIPPGMAVDHVCRNRSCVRPEHLRIVTHACNSRENSVSPFAKNAMRTHCSKCASPLIAGNVIWKPCKNHANQPMATRQCLVCWRAKHPTTIYRPNSREDALAVAREKYGHLRAVKPRRGRPKNDHQGR